MESPRFKDGTRPIHTAVGLSLLLAEVVEGPFGGHFITFSANPKVLSVGGPNDTRTLFEKVRYMVHSDWDTNTDFLALFERLILPMAIANKLKQEDMVKQIFVFSDMQFDEAGGNNKLPETAYERIKRRYAEAGYEVPQLVFWNLSGHSSDYANSSKPVRSGTEGTMLVNGYSQAMLKMFLDKGHFEEDLEDEEMESEDMEDEDEDEDGMVQIKTKKRKVDPMAGLRKAIGHKAYSMLKVVD